MQDVPGAGTCHVEVQRGAARCVRSDLTKDDRVCFQSLETMEAAEAYGIGLGRVFVPAERPVSEVPLSPDVAGLGKARRTPSSRTAGSPAEGFGGKFQP